MGWDGATAAADEPSEAVVPVTQGPCYLPSSGGQAGG